MILDILTLFSFTLAVFAHSLNHHGHSSRSLQGTWYHERSHPVHSLFKRTVGADGQDYPDVGTQTWSAKYPVNTPFSGIPQEWAAALKKAEDAGKIPNIPHATAAGVYPNANPAGPDICSASVKCFNPGDIWEAPQGTFATNFDDGPTANATKLIDFLKSKNEHATHFLIGRTIRENPEPFKAILASGDDLAVHTYTHPEMTTLSNSDVVAEIGWTMQIIHDSTGGKVPRFWRPPKGDSDNRVRAIAAEVFGLRTVIWNRDTFDWDMPHTTRQTIDTTFTGWLKGPKSPGILILEHEHNTECFQIFIDHYDEIKANGWTMVSLASLVDNKVGAYRNVANGQVKAASIVASGSSSPGNPSGPTNSSTSNPNGNTSGSTNTTTSPPSNGSDAASPPTPTNGSTGWRQQGAFTTTTFVLGVVVFSLL